MSAVVTRRFDATDADAVLAMYDTVLGRSRTGPEVERRLEHGPAGPARRQVAVVDGSVVGHTALLPLDAWVDGDRRSVPLSVDSMVVPTHQGCGLYSTMISAIRCGPPMGDTCLAFTTDAGLAKLERVGGSASQERLSQWVRWHDLEHLRRSAGGRLPDVVATFAPAGLRAVRVIAIAPGVGVRVDDDRPHDDEVDELAAASAAFASRIHIRDAAYLRWRWDDSDGEWSLLAARSRSGSLLGWVVYGIDPRRSTGTGVIADILARSPRALSALIRRAADELANRGAGLVTFSYRDPRWWSSAAVASAGFVRRGVAPPILLAALSDEGTEMLDIAGWYITSGELV